MCIFGVSIDPEFVSSAFIKEDDKNNPTSEDDKIYFFFTEVAKEYDLYTKVKVPRVARVCKVRNRLNVFNPSLFLSASMMIENETFALFLSLILGA